MTLDDLHWQAQATLAAVRALRRPGRRPVAWVMAQSSTTRSAADHLFDLLEQDGAVRITLAPLEPGAVRDLLAAAFGAPPVRPWPSWPVAPRATPPCWPG